MRMLVVKHNQIHQNYEIPGFEGTLDALDDALDIRPKETPKAVDSPKEYDMDTFIR